MSLAHTLRRLRVPIRRLAPRRGVLAYLAMMGPGFVTASAGNDAGGIATYAQAGAAYGYKLLWAMVLTAVALLVVMALVFIAYIPAALKAEHHWDTVLGALVTPALGGGPISAGLVAFLIP